MINFTKQNSDSERFHQIFEAVPSGIVMIDVAGTIVLCNSEIERLFKYKRNELYGQPIEVLVPARFRQSHYGNRSEYLRSPHKRKMGEGRDLTAVAKDGTEFPVEIGLSPVQNNEGNFVIATVVDITQRKLIEIELREALQSIQIKNDELEQFVYSISHDLKAPLVTSSSFLGFLKEDLAQQNSEEVYSSLERIERAHKRMRNLIEDLLEFSRIGRINSQLQQIDLGKILLDVLDGRREKLKELKFSVHVADEFNTLVGDPRRIRQAIDNLIGNAIKYGAANPNPELNIFCKETDSHLEICVKDNGIGIDPKYQKKIFTLFQRLDTTPEGTGVGLAIVSRVAQSHGGRAWVVSELNQGAEFWISISKHLTNSQPTTSDA